MCTLERQSLKIVLDSITSLVPFRFDENEEEIHRKIHRKQQLLLLLERLAFAAAAAELLFIRRQGGVSPINRH